MKIKANHANLAVCVQFIIALHLLSLIYLNQDLSEIYLYALFYMH